MKKLLIVSIVVGMLIGAGGCAEEQAAPGIGWGLAGDATYGVFSGGHGGESDSSSISMEGIWPNQSGERDSFIGFGGTVIFAGSGVPSDTLDYPCPHGDYTNKGLHNGPEFGVFGKYGLEVVENTGLFVNAIGGVTFAAETQLAQSNVTGWHYNHGSDMNTYGLYGIGISYLLGLDNELYIQTDYDNRRGITVGLGWKF